jgi:hypothetical protein
MIPDLAADLSPSRHDPLRHGGGRSLGSAIGSALVVLPAVYGADIGR